jgi:DNA-binding transcriptional regulator GbsR (MarR family)
MNNPDPPNMDYHIPKLTPELSKFIENLARFFESYGIPRIGSRILGLLMVANEPLSAEDIADILKVSRASVSTNMRFALQIGLAEKVTYPGNRITYYAFPETGMEKTLATEIETISVMKRFVEQGLNALAPGDAARSRLELLADWADFLMQVWQKALLEWRERQSSVTH